MAITGNIYGFLGFYHHTKGNIDKALKYYQRAVDGGVSKPRYFLGYGVLLLRCSRFEEASELLRRILIDFPHDKKSKGMAKMNLALAYWKLGDMDTAVEMMTEVHNALHNSKTYGSLGYLLIEKGDLDKALRFNQSALDYDDEDPVILDNMGQNLYAMGKHQEALEYFKRAETEKSNQVDILYHLGCVYQDLGDKELAREKYEQALNCNINALNTVTREDIEKKLEGLA